ncbi:LLM class flavin-dependent oxidoreductase [Pseudonocardia aurantiaca]|uniref:LLM class flavin-dependent oxidoreductase n=1 Tax=Pseudonocardia aurantiaca TaxID=75290 RepID=A0ABW4FLZ3_9PSEU
MEIGIGLPAAVPGTDGATIVEWAESASDAGFPSLGVLDRIVYDSYDPIAVLGAAAAIADARLIGAVLLVPFRGSGAVIAKQLASVDRLSLGRLTVAVVVGDREDDYAVSGADFERRGPDHDRMLEEMHLAWRGEAMGVTGSIGPTPAQHGGPPVLVGGYGPAAIRRVVRYGAGWISGGGGPEAFRRTADRVRAAWAESDREGDPYLAAMGHFALGEHGRAVARRYLTDYYGFLGGDAAESIAARALTDTETLRREIDGYEAAGCDELVLFPCSADPDEIDLLAQAALAAESAR